jgi:predicted PurR-regulated permease PerM
MGSMTTSTTPAPRDLTRITLSILGIGILIGGSLWVLRPFLVALIWATLIVVSTWPILIGVQKWLGGKRGAAVAVMTGVLLLILFVPLYLAVSTILEQSDRIVEIARGLSTRRLPPPPSWVDGLPVIGGKLAERWLSLAALEPQELTARLTPYLRTALAWFAAQAGSFGSMVVQFLLTVVIAAILYARGESAAVQLRRFFRRLAAERGDPIVTLAGKAIRAVALGIVVTAIVQTAIAGIGLGAVGIPFAGVLTAIVFLLCIAQLGPLLVLVPAAIWLYATDSPVLSVIILVVALLAQVIDNVVRPILIKRGADLSLLLILPGVIGGLLWLGIIGLFVGPVILAVTSALLESWMSSGLDEPVPERAAPVAASPAEPVLRGGGKVTPSA